MYTCERCGTGFGRPAATSESCPRCLARDGVRVALAFRLVEERQGVRTALRPGVSEVVGREAPPAPPMIA